MPEPAKGCAHARDVRQAFEADRRSLLKLGLGGLCFAVLHSVDAQAQTDATSAPPQDGDLLVKSGDATAKPLTVADVPAGASFISAFPMDPASKVVRNGSRLNEVVLIKLDPSQLSPESRVNAANGVLAYSALCTHAGCDVSTWLPEEGVLSCDCHGSEFDARSAGKVTVGPAARALPPLALTASGETLVVARSFSSAIRFDEA